MMHLFQSLTAGRSILSMKLFIVSIIRKDIEEAIVQVNQESKVWG
jgi:nitrogen fixation protein